MTDDELMQNFLETVSYSGPVKNWRDAPETGASDDEPDDGMPAPRTAAKKRRPETAIHVAADKHAPAIKSLFEKAFAAGAQKIVIGKTSSPTVAVKLLEPAIQATADVLRSELEQRLLDCLEDGGQAAVELLRNGTSS